MNKKSRGINSYSEDLSRWFLMELFGELSSVTLQNGKQLFDTSLIDFSSFDL